MGYYTNLCFDANRELELQEVYDLGEMLSKTLDCEYRPNILQSKFNLYGGLGAIQSEYFDEELKWYRVYEDMVKISKSFNNITFVFTAFGEDNYIARYYFRSGDYYISEAKMMFDEVPDKFKVDGYGTYL